MMKITNRYIKELCTLMAVSVILCMIGSCKSTKGMRVQSSGQNTIIVRNDSVYVIDSVYVDRFRKGDTVFVYKDRYRLMTHETTRVDSFIKTDSVYVDVVKEKKVGIPWGWQGVIEAIVIVVALWLIRIGFNSLIKRW